MIYLQNTRFLVPYSAPVIGLISQFWWFHVVLYAKMSFLANSYENRIKNGEDINVCPNTPFWARISHILVFFFKTFDGSGELKFWPALMIKVILSPSQWGEHLKRDATRSKNEFKGGKYDKNRKNGIKISDFWLFFFLK